MERMNLLVCDLDGTLLGDERALDEFAAWYVRSRSTFRLAYASGRFVDSVRESISDTNLPEPDAIIGGVGTEIYDVSRGRKLAMWPPSIFEWNPHVVRAICAAHQDLTLQPEYFLSYYKVSLFGRNLGQSFLDHLILQMAAAGQRVAVVYSSDRDLDILPSEVDKGAAVRHLAGRWGIERQHIIVAGDSGNDAAMLRADFRGIVVGNALPELKLLKMPNIYHATANFAAGVLEGVDYWLRTPCAASTTDDR